MANDMDEFLLEEWDVYGSQIIRLQAFIRGSLVRKYITEIKQDYVDLFQEIEQNDRNTVEWPYKTLCYPVIQKRKKKDSRSSRPSPKSRQINMSSPRDDVSNHLSATSGHSSPHEDFYKVEKGQTFEAQGLVLESHLSTPRSDVLRISSASSKDFYMEDIDQNNKTSSPRNWSGVKNVDSHNELDKTSPISLISEKPEVGNMVVQPDKIINVNSINIPTPKMVSAKLNAKSDKVSQFCSVETQTNTLENCDSDSVQREKIPSKGESERDHIDSQQNVGSEFHQGKMSVSDKDTDAKINFKMSKYTVNTSAIISDPVKNKSDDNRSHIVDVETNEDIALQQNMDNRTEAIMDRNSQRSYVNTKPENLSRTSRKPELSTTGVTSVWDSVSSLQDTNNETLDQIYPADQESLQEMRKNIAMELLWVQQAINSRKNYLRLKNQMDLPVTT